VFYINLEIEKEIVNWKFMGELETLRNEENIGN
jgi:hypothetical protein